MLTYEALIAYCSFIIATSITPGPNNTLLLASGVNFGIMRTLPHWCGISTGMALQVILMGLGFSSLFMAFPALHYVIQILGSIYLLYLAYGIAFHSQLKTQQALKPMKFYQAILFQWVNPKAWIMSISAATVYAPTPIHWTTIIIMGILFAFVGFPCCGLWVMIGQGLKNMLANPLYLRLFNYIMGIALALSVLMLFI